MKALYEEKTYYDDRIIRVRNFRPEDSEIICAGEVAQGWDQTIDKYIDRLKDRDEGKCISLAAEYHGNIAGYINVYPDAKSGAFAGRGLPEIVDFGVLEKYRRRGIGKALMDAAEDIAKEYADTVYLGVGLHSGYGSAQRMYVKRGYIPDGSGVWYKDRPAEPYGIYPNDDELVIYMSKKLV